LSHRLWKLATTNGVFAIKQLNPQVTAREGAVDRFRASERVASAFRAGGVRAVVAVDASGDPLRQVDGSWYLAYPWTAGTTIELKEVTAQHARAIGATLATLHRRRLSDAGVPDRTTWTIAPDRWRDLARRSAGRSFSAQLHDALPTLATLSADASTAWSRLRLGPHVVSHRDVVPENVLWDGDTPTLVDWESSAWTSPVAELVAAAIDWSGFIEGRSASEIFLAVLDGYREHLSFATADVLTALPASAASWLSWLDYSIRRALGEAADPEEHALGATQATLVLRAIERIPRHLPMWQTWIARESRASE
jgi:Ser/Thr protein kinase RdoA (MazF antagonist)